MKKIILLVISFALLVAVLGGCSNSNSTSSTEEKEIIAVQNSYFDGYSKKTIGEYFKLYEQKALVPLGEDVVWSVVEFTDEIKNMLNDNDVDFNAKKEKLVMCAYNSKGSKSNIEAFISFLFAYDTSSKKTRVIEVMLNTTDNRSMDCTAPDEISAMVDMITQVAESQ